MKKLAGRVAKATGVSNAIVAATATALAAEGVAVAVNYSSGKEGVERVVSQIMR
jgi:3-oxoacyl-[acyl-carrier protein] reductase